MATRAEISQIYETILGRTPDAGGLDYWVSQLSGYSLADAAMAIAQAAAAMSPTGQTPEIQQAIFNAQKWLASGAVYEPPKTTTTTPTTTTTTPTKTTTTTTPTTTTTTPKTTTTTTPTTTTTTPTTTTTTPKTSTTTVSTTPPTSLLDTYEETVRNAYKTIGVDTPDAEGLNYWTNQLATGNISPAQFESTFLVAAAGVDPATAPDLAAAIATAQGLAPLSQQNYQTLYTTEQYRNLFGRNPEQEGYQYWMSRLQSDMTTDQLRDALILAAQGIDPNLYANLGQGDGYTNITVPSLEADPYAGRYATASIYDLLSDAVNVSSINGSQVQFVTPVGQMPIISTFNDGVFTYDPGLYTLNPDQLMGQMNVALETGALTQDDYNQMLYDIAAAQNVNDLMDAFNKAQAEINLTNTGTQTGVKGTTIDDFTNLVEDAYTNVDTRTQEEDVITPENMSDKVNNILTFLQRQYGQPLDLQTQLSPGYYSERGFEPGYTPMGEAPTFRSGVAGYTPNLPTGFTFGVVPVSAATPVFTSGLYNQNAASYSPDGVPLNDLGQPLVEFDQFGNPTQGYVAPGSQMFVGYQGQVFGSLAEANASYPPVSGD